ncbi:aminoglycoside phosphotransferase family protein [Streptomyces sp. NPDC058459]|uniref:aminoglycoside phosphotransferase family protein n=1 Tax=Streptomyces sp. NPDC058459 TaxID=3346508 RepID=UPI00365E1D6B
MERTVDVDRGAYPDVVTPWDQEAWRGAVFEWTDARLAAQGLRRSGVPRVRVRPWSVLMRLVPAGSGPVWFKANPPASAFEGPLTEALSRWVPERVLRPLAVDAGRGWSLLPDGGPLFREVGGDVPPRTWEELLTGYAAMQRALVPRADALSALGVPRLRVPEVPAAFDRLCAANVSLDPDRRARLDALRPRLADWCAELASLGVPDSLDHADLHEGQLFHPEPGRFTYFDWGDAVVSHPFASLRVPALRAAGRYGPEVLPRLRDAYLEPWTDLGLSAAELRRAVHLAWRLGALGRARAWTRLFPSATEAAPTAVEGARSLLETGDTPPL